MALNCSQRPIFPAHLSEDNLVSPMRIANGCLVEGVPERGGGEGCYNTWPKCHEIEDCFDYVRIERGERNHSPESSSKDIVDLLPSDPFGMDISTTFTAITGWLEDLEINCGGYGIINTGSNGGEYDFYTGFNFIWNNAVQFQAFPSNFEMGEKSDINLGGTERSLPQILEEEVNKEASPSGDDHGFPHPALFYALRFLGIRDLLLVEQVCKSLHSIVRSDSLLWRNINIHHPLNEKIGDGDLLKLVARSQGHLRSLSLIDCHRVTDEGLRAILDSNPKLTKLCVPGCRNISIEGVVNNLKAFNSKSTPGIKQLRIGGRIGIMDEHFKELKLLLGVDVYGPENDRKLFFYHERDLFLSCDDDRAIDIETCPKCHKSRLVYDCPYEGCREKGDALQACRACWLCIPRCHGCGRCITDCEYEETFNLELRCAGCKDGKEVENAESFELDVNSVHG